MNFIKKVVLLMCVFFAMPIIADSGFMEGQDYSHLPKAVKTQSCVTKLINKDPHQIQVLLFFSYGCRACAKLDPEFEKWAESQKNNEELVIYSFPVGFQDQWQMLAKMYYVMLDMKPQKNLSQKIFTAIHKENQKLWQEEEMRAFFINNGYKAKEFDTVFNSPHVSEQLKYADEVANAYSINSTPMIIINGVNSCYSLSVSQAEGIDRLMKVLNYLVRKETAMNSY